MAMKPRECEGCPLYAQSKHGFVADTIGAHHVAVVVQDVPAIQFDGETADETSDAKLWDREFRSQVGVESLGWAHLIRCKAGKVSGKLITGATAKKAIAHCRVHDRFGDKFLIALSPGGWSFFSKVKKARKNGRKDWRGFYVEAGI